MRGERSHILQKRSLEYVGALNERPSTICLQNVVFPQEIGNKSPLAIAICFQIARALDERPYNEIRKFFKIWGQRSCLPIFACITLQKLFQFGIGGVGHAVETQVIWMIGINDAGIRLNKTEKRSGIHHIDSFVS